MVEQGEALAAFAAARFPAESRAAAIVHSGDDRSRQVAAAIVARLNEEGISGILRRELTGEVAARLQEEGMSGIQRREAAAAAAAQLEDEAMGAIQRREVADREQQAAARLAAELRDAGTAALFFAGNGAAAIGLLEAGAGMGWEPLLFMAGSTAGGDLFAAPASADGRIFLSFPAFPTDRTEAAMLEYRSLLEAYALPPGYQSMQLTALASARLLLEGLARSGRDLSREKLVTALEGVYAFETGLMPPISYGPNRRIGALGAYVVGVDLQAGSLGPTVEWVPLR
jgi:ABC-type branched-subunit amino acid transport system substrate-binding protein